MTPFPRLVKPLLRERKWEVLRRKLRRTANFLSLGRDVPSRQTVTDYLVRPWTVDREISYARPEILADVASLAPSDNLPGQQKSGGSIKTSFPLRVQWYGSPRPEHPSAPFGAAALLRFHSSPTLVTRFTSWIGSRCWSVTARRADIRARVNAQIRDCNKTTDVRTTDSRTGIAPPSPLARRTLLSRTLPRSFLPPLAVPPSVHSSLALSALPRFLPPRWCSPFTSRRSNLSSLLFPCFSFYSGKRTERASPLPLNKKKNRRLPGETDWSSVHALPAAFRKQLCGNLSNWFILSIIINPKLELN